MKLYLSLFFLLDSLFCFSQFDRKIEADSLLEVDTLKDGSQLIYHLINKNQIDYLYSNAKGDTLEKGQYSKSGKPIGNWLIYNNFGLLEKTKNFDTNEWNVWDTSKYPYKTTLDSIKVIADSIVRETYGITFFLKHIRWDLESSTVYFSDSSGKNWTESFEEQPKYFLLKYNLVLNKMNYGNQIEFYLDKHGNFFFPDSIYSNVKGFEKRNNKDDFNIDNSFAISKAKQFGLKEFEVNNIKEYLVWKFTDTTELKRFNGRFLFYLVSRNEGQKKLNRDGISLNDKYTVYIFDPWSGNYLGKRSMKSFMIPHSDSNFITGLVQD